MHLYRSWHDFFWTGVFVCVSISVPSGVFPFPVTLCAVQNAFDIFSLYPTITGHTHEHYTHYAYCIQPASAGYQPSTEIILAKGRFAAVPAFERLRPM